MKAHMSSLVRPVVTIALAGAVLACTSPSPPEISPSPPEMKTPQDFLRQIIEKEERAVAQSAIVAEIAPEDAVLRFAGAAEHAATVRVVRYFVPRPRSDFSEYLAYDGADGRVELLYESALVGSTYVGHRATLGASLGFFRYLEVGPNPTGPSEMFEIGPARGFYRAFDLGSMRQACVGFKADWDALPDDRLALPRKHLTGYFCVPGGAPLTSELARNTIERIDVRPLPDDPERVEHRLTGEAALTLARRGPAGDGGTVAFAPFR